MNNSQLIPYITGQAITLSTATPYVKLDWLKLSNQSRSPMLIDEIRFVSPRFFVDPFLYVGLNAKFGWTPMTHGYVPIGVVGKSFNRRSRYIANANTGGNNQYAYERIWRFRKPIFIDSNGLMSLELQLLPEFNQALATELGLALNTLQIPISIVLVCRSMPLGTPPPRRNELPWVTAWRTANFPLGQKTIDRSINSQLQNPGPEDVKITSFTGRLFTQFGDAIEPTFGLQTTSGFAGSNTPDANPRIYETDVTVSAKHVNGNQLIKDPAPFAHIFSTTDDSWFPNAVLRPQGYYIFTISADLRAYNPATLPAPLVDSVNFAYIAINGSKQIDLR